MPVPEVLLGGNHAEIARWRREAALSKTRRNRPDLLDGARREVSSDFRFGIGSCRRSAVSFR